MLDNPQVATEPEDHMVAALRRLADSVGGRKALAHQIGANDQTLYQILSGVTHPKTGRRRGIGPSLRDRISQHYPTWLDSHTPVLGHSLGGPQVSASLAQQLSDPTAIIRPTTIEWDLLMSLEPLPTVFCAAIPDDAMAPEFPKGCTVLFSTTEGPARPRDAVLVRDQQGNLYFREFQQRTPQHFMAAATGGGVLPLDSQTDGLAVVAICVGKWGRRG